MLKLFFLLIFKSDPLMLFFLKNNYFGNKYTSNLQFKYLHLYIYIKKLLFYEEKNENICVIKTKN